MEAQLFAIGIPTVTVLVGILLNNKRIDELRADMTGLRTDITRQLDKQDEKIEKLDSQIREIHHEMREFYKVISEHDFRLQALERSAS